MKHPNELVQQMDTKGPFYLKGSRNKHYFIHVIDDCSRKVVSKWCNRRNSEKALLVFKEWIELHGKPMKVMHMMVVKNLHLSNSKIILYSME